MKTWECEYIGKDVAVVEKEFRGKIHRFDVNVNGEYIGTIIPETLEEYLGDVEELDKHGASIVLLWHDGYGHGIFFEKDTDFYRYWHGEE